MLIHQIPPHGVREIPADDIEIHTRAGRRERR
jgi:hypothetical protein